MTHGPFYGRYAAGRGANPPSPADGSMQGGRLQTYRERFTLAGQAVEDRGFCFSVSKGSAFRRGSLICDVSLGAGQISVGVTLATPQKYHALSTLVPNTPTEMNPLDPLVFYDELAGDEDIWISMGGVTNWPANGTLIVDMEFIAP